MKIRFYIVVILPLILSGCTLFNQPSTLQPRYVEIEQLATVVASARFLREKCGETTISEDRVLIDTAIKEARNKGNDLPASASASIQARSGVILSGLIHDGTPQEEKCDYFRGALAGFLSKAYQSNETAK